jgi:hypothetical protein
VNDKYRTRHVTYAVNVRKNIETCQQARGSKHTNARQNS